MAEMELVGLGGGGGFWGEDLWILGGVLGIGTGGGREKGGGKKRGGGGGGGGVFRRQTAEYWQGIMRNAQLAER